MRVNLYTDHGDKSNTMDHQGTCELSECFPGPENGDEYLLAHTELDRTGRYWGGGGASPLFLIMRIRE